MLQGLTVPLDIFSVFCSLSSLTLQEESQKAESTERLHSGPRSTSDGTKGTFALYGRHWERAVVPPSCQHVIIFHQEHIYISGNYETTTSNALKIPSSIKPILPTAKKLIHPRAGYCEDFLPENTTKPHYVTPVALYLQLCVYSVQGNPQRKGARCFWLRRRTDMCALCTCSEVLLPAWYSG